MHAKGKLRKRATNQEIDKPRTTSPTEREPSNQKQQVEPLDHQEQEMQTRNTLTNTTQQAAKQQ